MGAIDLFFFLLPVGFTLLTANNAWGVKWTLMVLLLD
jgi:hypothetical protein